MQDTAMKENLGKDEAIYSGRFKISFTAEVADEDLLQNTNS